MTSMNNGVKAMVDYLCDDHRILSCLLGGSRAKGIASNESDYDFFLIVTESSFFSFRIQFCDILEACEQIIFASEYGYIENWGYAFKAIGMINELYTEYDFFIIPNSRINEIALRKYNIVLYDTNDIAKREIINNNNSKYDAIDLEPGKRLNYVKQFGFEYLKFVKSIHKKDLWYAIKAVENMKSIYIRYARIKNLCFSGNQYKADKYFSYDFPNDDLNKIYRISYNSEDVLETGKTLVNLFFKMIEEKEILSYYLNNICSIS